MATSLLIFVVALALLPLLSPAGDMPVPDEPSPAIDPAATTVPVIGDAITAVESAILAQAEKASAAAAANAALLAANAAVDATTAVLSSGLKKIGSPAFMLAADSSVVIYEYDDVKGFKKFSPLPPSTPIPA